MSENKTKKNNSSVRKFLDSIADEQKRRDSKAISRLMKELTGKSAKMWGTAIVGFGDYHYKYKSGREGDFFVTGFSPRKQNLTIYIVPGFSKYKKLLTKLGKHKTSVSCLYIKRISDIDMTVLAELISLSIQDMHKIYDCK